MTDPKKLQAAQMLCFIAAMYAMLPPELRKAFDEVNQ